MILRKLEPEEFGLLDQVGDGLVLPPDKVVAIAALEGHQLLGRVCVMGMAHIEGTWVREDHRRGMLGAFLLARAESAARSLDVKRLFAYSPSKEIDGYLSRLGYAPLSWTVFEKEL